MNKLKTVVFDFDGTIADSFGELVKILNKILPDFDLPKITEKELDFFREKGMRKTLEKINFSKSRITTINSRLKKEISKKMERINLVGEIKDVLFSLIEKGYILGILTGNSREGVKKLLEKNKLEIFDFVDVDKGILNKHIALEKMMKLRGFKKKDFVYVGDEVRDIEACKKVGVKIIAVSWGFNDYKVLKKYKPDWLVKKPEELLDILHI